MCYLVLPFTFMLCKTVCFKLYIDSFPLWGSIFNIPNIRLQAQPCHIEAWPCLWWKCHSPRNSKADTAKPESGLTVPHTNPCNMNGRHGQAKIQLGRATWLIPDAKIFLRVLCNRDIAQFKCGGGIRIRIKFLLSFYLLVVFLLNSFSFYDLSLVFDFNKSFKKKRIRR